jgi:hypothetical protein
MIIDHDKCVNVLMNRMVRAREHLPDSATKLLVRYLEAIDVFAELY